MASYWRITAIKADLDAQDSSVTLSGYIDHQHRIDGLKPIESRIIRWTGSQNPISIANMLAGTAIEAAYEKLKEVETRAFMPANPFAGALDI